MLYALSGRSNRWMSDRERPCCVLVPPRRVSRWNVVSGRWLDNFVKKIKQWFNVDGRVTERMLTMVPIRL